MYYNKSPIFPIQRSPACKHGSIIEHSSGRNGENQSLKSVPKYRSPKLPKNREKPLI